MGQYAETKVYEGFGKKEVPITTVYVREDLIHMIYEAKIYTIQKYGDVVSVDGYYEGEEYLFNSWNAALSAVRLHCRGRGTALKERAVQVF